jgi:hypothetical protein
MESSIEMAGKGDNPPLDNFSPGPSYMNFGDNFDGDDPDVKATDEEMSESEVKIPDESSSTVHSQHQCLGPGEGTSHDVHANSATPRQWCRSRPKPLEPKPSIKTPRQTPFPPRALLVPTAHASPPLSCQVASDVDLVMDHNA